MDQLLQHGLNALMLGGIYALLGIGLTLIFGIMRLVNFTHGELYAFGAYMMYLCVMLLGVNFFVALALAVALGVALGASIEFTLLRKLRGADIDTTMLVLIAATYAIINHTRLGKAMRATFQDRETAALMGIQIGMINTATFALGSGLAAAAGALLGPVFVAYPTMGDLAAAKAFAIVILGGLGSIAGATVGGFILALVEELGAAYISSGYRDAMGFLIIILILIFKPTGLFAQKERVG